MPKTPVNYDNVHFYKLVCKDLNVTECYIGHSTAIRNRKNQAKITCTNPENAKHCYPVYKHITENGGWENWDMILIEQCKLDLFN